MSILLIRQAPQGVPPAPLPARIGGHALHCRDGDSLPALLDGLHQARDTRPAWVLIETAVAGAPQWDQHGQALLAALEALPVPYIEMVRNDADALDAHLHPQHAPAVVVCTAQRDQARQLSLAIAARRLQAMEA